MTSLSVIGSLVAIIILALINSVADTGLTGGQVVLYGLIAGIVLGVFTTYLLIRFLIVKARKFIYSKFGVTLTRLGLLKRL